MYSVSEYAKEAGLSVARVRALASNGQISARKLGSQWAIFSEPQDYRGTTGRKLSQKSFDNLAFSFENNSQKLSPDEKRNLKKRKQQLLQEKMTWVEKHTNRAGENVKSYSVPQERLLQISSQVALQPTGTSHTATNVFGNLLHAYIQRKKLKKLELVYGLKEAPLSEANIVLRTVDIVPQISKLRLICDLAYEQDPRAAQEAEKLLENLLENAS